ncbi:MAG: sigma-70 family RNA polymerase sigma factor, partial [Gaiellaceae bacterium]
PFTQATLLELYDPDRSQHVTWRGENREWAEFAQGLRVKMAESKDGTGMYFLSATITSPTLARQWKEVQAAYPRATLVQYDPAIAGTAFADGLNVQYDLAQADVIVSLDSDFLSGASYPGFHKLVRQYAERRKDPSKLNRLYSIESTPTTTGLKAEHRLGLRASEISAFTAELAKAVGVPAVEPPAWAWTEEQKKFLATLVKDLTAHAGRCVVIPGLYQDLSVWELTFSINGALRNLGETVHWASDPAIRPPSDQIRDLKVLVADLNGGKVDWLIILNANPIYSAPADLNFVERLQKMNRAERTLWTQLGREPTLEEIAEEAGLPAQQAYEVKAAARASTSLDQPVGDEDDAVFGDFVPGEGPLPEEQVEVSLRTQALSQALHALPERERSVLLMRYGIEGNEPRTLEEIGRCLGLTRERVRQIEVEALRQLSRLREMQSVSR